MYKITFECDLMGDHTAPISNLCEVDSVSFDDQLTAPIHGFANAADYYRRSSCRSYLNKISLPTLIVQSKDDPFLPINAIPIASDLSNQVRLVLTNKGGHVGFLGRGEDEWFLKSTITKFVCDVN